MENTKTTHLTSLKNFISTSKDKLKNKFNNIFHKEKHEETLDKDITNTSTEN